MITALNLEQSNRSPTYRCENGEMGISYSGSYFYAKRRTLNIPFPDLFPQRNSEEILNLANLRRNCRDRVLHYFWLKGKVYCASNNLSLIFSAPEMIFKNNLPDGSYKQLEEIAKDTLKLRIKIGPYRPKIGFSLDITQE